MKRYPPAAQRTKKEPLIDEVSTRGKLSIRQVVDAYLKSSGLDTDSVEACFDTCKFHAHKLVQALKKHGYDADMVQVVGPAKKLFDKDLHPEWIEFLSISDKARNSITHYVVEVDGKIVDITGRQFGKKSGGVRIVPKQEFLSDWDSHNTVRRGAVIESAIKVAVREVTAGYNFSYAAKTPFGKPVVAAYEEATRSHKPLSVGDLQRINAPVLSEMKVIKVGKTAPKYGWNFMAYRDKVWLVDPDEWEPADGADLYKALVKNLGDEDIPNPMDADGYYDWVQQLDEILVDFFAGTYDPDTYTITASHTDSPSFRSSPLVKKVVKALGAMTVDYEGEYEFDRGEYIDTRDKLPDVMYHGTSTHALQRILRQGLRPGNPTNWTGDNYHGTFDQHIFMTDSPIHARWHAADTARKKGGEAVVLKVKIPDKDKLTPDWDADSFSKSQKKTFQKVNKSPNNRSTVGSWKTSKAFGRFGYKGRIPASHIELEAWSPDAGTGEENPEWQENYPGDKAIWELFAKYIKDGTFDDLADAWQVAVEGGYEDEDEEFEEAVGSTAGHDFYYHGTSGEVGRKILEAGYINPPDIGRRKAALTPRKGMVYLASNIEYALAYALGGATEGYDFSQYADNWWWRNKGEAAIVRVKAEDMQDADPDEDDIADIITSHERDSNPEKHALADRIYRVYVKGNPKMEQKWKELRYDPALHKAVRLVKQLLKKIPRSGDIWADIKKVAGNAAHPGRVKVHDVMFFKAPELSQVKRPKGGYTFNLIAKKVGEIEKPSARAGSPVVAEAYTDFDSAPINLLKHEQWRDLFFKEPTEKEVKAFRKFLRENKEKQIVLYHGTGADIKVMEQGLLPTSAKRRRSLQSGSGYVYLSVYPDMAKTFAKMGYPEKDVVVYAVTIPIHKLSPDKDQLRNQRQWAGYDGKDDLAASFLYGKGARFKGKIEPWQIKVEEGKPVVEGVLLEAWEIAPEQSNRAYEGAEPDDYYYHVTTKEAAEEILANGLRPNMPATFSNYSSISKGKVFLCDRDGVDFWQEHVELHLFSAKDYDEDEDPADDIVVLRIPKSEVKVPLKVDKSGTDDSRANAWYATQLIEAHAYHLTTPEAKAEILEKGFEASDRGWYGPGLYAHTGPGAREGKGKEQVRFSIDDLKLAIDGVPDELEGAQLKAFLKKDNEAQNKQLRKMGYDGLAMRDKGWVVIFPQSIDKVKPLQENCNIDDVSEKLKLEAKGRPGGWIGPVYHGSRNKFLKSLDIGQHGQGTVMVSGRHKTPAIYFTSSKENARFYADPKNEDDHDEYVYSAYVRFKNPLVVDEDHGLWKRHSPPQIATKAKEAGHDGFIIKDYTDGAVPSTIYGVFDNDNVRLVGNLKEPGPNLGSDSEIDPDNIIIVPGDDGYYAFFDDEDGNALNGPGPFKTDDEAEREALRLVKKHNASLTPTSR